MSDLQYIFSIPHSSSFREEDYIVSHCNSEAYHLIKSWPQWAGDSIYNNFMFLSGDCLSGKSHLASIWQKESDARYVDMNFINNKQYIGKSSNYILDNIDFTTADESAMFHFINYVAESTNFLLITSRINQFNIDCHLKDLASRIKAMPSVALLDPDEEFIEKIIIKYFSDLQVSVTYDVVKFLKMRVDRSYHKLFSILDVLNMRSLSQKKKISISFIKQILKI